MVYPERKGTCRRVQQIPWLFYFNPRRDLGDSGTKVRTQAYTPDEYTQPHFPTPDLPSKNLTSRFDALKLEDYDLNAYELLPSVAPKPILKDSDMSNIFELELTLEAELPFMIFCFFEDLNRIRDFLETIWNEVKNGTLDNTPASLVPNIALELIKRAENDMISISPERFSKETCRSMTSMIQDMPTIPWELPLDQIMKSCTLPADCRKFGPPTAHKEKDFFVFMDTFFTLEKY